MLLIDEPSHLQIGGDIAGTIVRELVPYSWIASWESRGWVIYLLSNLDNLKPWLSSSRDGLSCKRTFTHNKPASTTFPKYLKSTTIFDTTLNAIMSSSVKLILTLKNCKTLLDC